MEITTFVHDERLRFLNDWEARAIQAFCDWLAATMPDQVERLILFGSKSRGDAHNGSDVDLLLELREETPERREAIAIKMGDILEEMHVDLAVVTYDSQELAYWQVLGTPFIRNVADEGIALWGEVFTVDNGKPQQVAQGFLKSAHEHLRMAQWAVNNDLPRRCVSEAYYIFLDAADAALVAKDIRTHSHSGTIDFFGLHFVKPGLVDAKFAKWFKKIRDNRLDADYERMRVFTEAEARQALDQATEFLATIEALLPSLPSDVEGS
jgi:uncharacterized protein (UPF0332 family)/predicted nucleotidyltransferase